MRPPGGGATLGSDRGDRPPGIDRPWKRTLEPWGVTPTPGPARSIFGGGVGGARDSGIGGGHLAAHPACDGSWGNWGARGGICGFLREPSHWGVPRVSRSTAVGCGGTETRHPCGRPPWAGVRSTGLLASEKRGPSSGLGAKRVGLSHLPSRRPPNRRVAVERGVTSAHPVGRVRAESPVARRTREGPQPVCAARCPSAASAMDAQASPSGVSTFRASPMGWGFCSAPADASRARTNP